MNGVIANCAFCDQRSREHPVTADGLTLVISLYLAHLIESHWGELVQARNERMTQGPVTDAWTRL